jgi:hypothetical protein
MTPGRIRAARLLAVAADFVQIVAFPIFGGGGASPWNDALDFVVAAAATALVGWHWAFLPTFFAELVPGLDLVPTWTVAVFLATRGKARASSPETAREGAIETEVVSRDRDGPPTGSKKPASDRPPRTSNSIAPR